MKKIGVLILLLLIFPLTSAQEQEDIDQEISGNDLVVRFHSFGRQASIDLKIYLGESDEYFHTPSENVTIDIDQNTGVATLLANPGWEGVETITFTTFKPTSLITLRDKPVEIIITDPEITKIFQEIINNSFTQVTDSVEIQSIRRLETNIEDGELMINLNDEAEIFFSVLANKPNTQLNILIPNAGPPELTVVDTSKINIAIAILIFFVLLWLFRKQIRQLLFLKEKEIDLKVKYLNALIKIKRTRNKEEREKDLFNLLQKFFRTFGIKQISTRIEINRAFEKRNIKGDLKQHLLYLFSKYSSYESEDKEEIMRTFRSVLGRI